MRNVFSANGKTPREKSWTNSVMWNGLSGAEACRTRSHAWGRKHVSAWVMRCARYQLPGGLDAFTIVCR